jgi:hypothetical protein
VALPDAALRIALLLSLFARIGTAFYRTPLPYHSLMLATMAEVRVSLSELHCVGVGMARASVRV